MSAPRGASRTALGTAYLRAAHQLLDETPLILDDPIAVPLIGADGQRNIEEHPERFQKPEQRALRSHLVIRSRFAEDRLEAAMEREVGTYVILGAGFDTFAYRQPDWAKRLRIIEVDHPESQQAKRMRLDAAGIGIPSNVEFADIDFEHETLDEGFRRHGISTLQKTFFSWLGVTMYLTEDAVEEVFREIARFPAGSEVAFTFSQPRKPDDLSRSGAAQTSLASMVAMIGEPWLTFYEPERLGSILYDCGFSEVFFLTPEETWSRYLAGRPADLPVPRRTSIVSAIR